MVRAGKCAAVLAAASVISLPAWSQEADIRRLREEIRELREAYERRIEALEKRLREAEARTAPAPVPQAEGPRAFNPEISLILQGTLARSSRDPETYEITGFAPSGGEVGPPRRGFSLAESELVVSANVDPYFSGKLVAALTPENEVEVEEAYFRTLALGGGFTLKGGRFLSGIGYLNEIHPHAWDFQDAPLPYRAFLGGRLGDDGLQLRWVAPTRIFVELGAEAARGRGFPSTDRPRHGAAAWSLFGRLGGDLGASTAWRAGLSYLRASARDRAFTDHDSLDNDVTQSFSGRSRLWIADFVLKWAPDGNPRATNFKLQGEYFRRHETGTLTYDDTPVLRFGAVFTDAYSSRQSGWYLQAVYQFMPRWRLGYRHDRLDYGSVYNAIVANGLGPTAADFPLLMTRHNPTRRTAMIDWSPSEYSRLRLQLASDRSRFGLADRQALVQYIHSIGPHGAHRF